MKNVCIRRIILSVFSVLLLFILGMGLFKPSPVLAAIDVSLSPSSGTIDDSTTISIEVNTNGDEIGGIGVDVGFSGDVEFVSGTEGDISTCVPTIDEGDTGNTVNAVCFVQPIGDTYSGSGTLAELEFAATGDGEATLSIDEVDVDGDVGDATGGTYTTTTDSGGDDGEDDNGGDTDGEDDLPDTSVLDNIFIVTTIMFTMLFGVFMLVHLGYFDNFLYDFYSGVGGLFSKSERLRFKREILERKVDKLSKEEDK